MCLPLNDLHRLLMVKPASEDVFEYGGVSCECFFLSQEMSNQACSSILYMTTTCYRSTWSWA